MKKQLLTYSALVCSSILALTSCSLFGKKNKAKMINGFMEKLNVSEERADEIYNTFMDIFKRRIKWKICHPFKSYDKKKKED